MMVRLRARAAATKWPPLPALAALRLFIPRPPATGSQLRTSGHSGSGKPLRSACQIIPVLSDMAWRHAACS